MDILLDEFIENSFTQELGETVRSIIGFYANGDREGFEEEIITMMLAPVRDADGEGLPKNDDTTREQVLGYLDRVLREDLVGFGITPVEHARLHELFTVLVGVQSIEDYDDLATIIQIASSEEDDLEKIAQILDRVSLLDAYSVIDLIDEVSHALIERINDLAVNQSEAAYSEMEYQRIKEIVPTLRAYANWLRETGFETIPAFEYLKDTRIGDSFELYLDNDVVVELLEAGNMQKTAMNLYALALASSDARNDPVDAIRKQADKLLSDTVQIVKLNNETTKVNGNFSKALAQVLRVNKLTESQNG